MKLQTIEALEKVAAGIEELLSALTAEPSTHVNYNALKLSEACRELRHVLGEEEISK